MTFSTLTIIALVLLCAGILAWNFYPPLRAKMRGWSTILEGILGTGMYYFEIFSGALQEGQEAGYIPENIEQYVPFVILGWILVKRFQTKTPVGQK